MKKLADSAVTENNSIANNVDMITLYQFIPLNKMFVDRSSCSEQLNNGPVCLLQDVQYVMFECFERCKLQLCFTQSDS